MRGTLIASTAIHVTLLSALFIVHPERTIVLPGPDVVQVALIGEVPPPPPPPAPVVKANDAVVPDENQGVRIEKPRPKPKPEVKQQPKPVEPPKPASPPPDDTPRPPAAARQLVLPMAQVANGVSGQVAVDDASFEFTYYLQVVRAQIARNWTPPAGSNPGTRVEVYFRVARSGEITALRVESGSGIDGFDDSAIRAVTITEQLPPLPLGYAGADLGIHFGFEYTGPSIATRRPPARSLALLALLTLAAAGRAHAQADVHIDVKSGAIARLPLRCEALQGPQSGAAPARDADGVLANDLQASAVFEVDRAWAPATGEPQPQFVTAGRWSVDGSQVKLAGELRDFPARREILIRDYTGPASEWRRLLHRFSDDCVQQITGERGVADSRIAFVVKDGQNKELWIMDADGANAHVLTADKSIVQSPSWSPEGSLLLFTSWRAGNGPAIWVMSPEARKPFLISGRPGLNTSAAYSPDGQHIACTLSQDGNAEIYVLDARGGNAQRLTNHRSIDTAPAWSPTGRELAFTSDRSGSPQIYLMDAVGGSIRRLTFDVDYTDSPAWSPKGDRIAFVTRVGGGFDVWTCRADGTGARAMVTGGNNENPRWSADGRHLVFASDRDGGYGLWVTDLDGAVPRKLDAGGRRAMSPAWSPRRSTSP